VKRLRRALSASITASSTFRSPASGRAAGTDERGFIVIQIDALAHEDLVRAIERGYAPAPAPPDRARRLGAAPLPAGLPSATPAAQAAIFYGTKRTSPRSASTRRRNAA
jgi:hypothetical protein